MAVLSHGQREESPWASARSEKSDPVVIRENFRKSLTGGADSQREDWPQLQVSDRLGTLSPHGPEFTVAKVSEQTLAALAMKLRRFQYLAGRLILVAFGAVLI